MNILLSIATRGWSENLVKSYVGFHNHWTAQCGYHRGARQGRWLGTGSRRSTGPGSEFRGTIADRGKRFDGLKKCSIERERKNGNSLEPDREVDCLLGCWEPWPGFGLPRGGSLFFLWLCGFPENLRFEKEVGIVFRPCCGCGGSFLFWFPKFPILRSWCSCGALLRWKLGLLQPWWFCCWLNRPGPWAEWAGRSFWCWCWLDLPW